MRTLASTLFFLLLASMIAACSGNDVADETKLSDQGKEVVQALGGPFTADEFKRFLADLPKISDLTAATVPETDDSGAALNVAVRNKLEDLGWDKDRFLYIYSHAMAMVNLDQMQRLTDQMQAQFKDMPEEQREAMEQMISKQMGGQMGDLRADVDKHVPATEQAIVNDNMKALMNAMGMR
ncbi:hypothetical protein [uncultured Pseudodesulfovibrio sp.]|uniref:hypothetical protein n=1 Tax=uncultured Pseudodesulfovibrio sp. TaxID=2035858 RepID=UPI0029C8E658|nr:hypothetical protein [uncultured Pseudodesulfovibrio sp.]